MSSLVNASKGRTGREYRATMDDLVRPPFIPSAPTAKKLWSLKEQQEFYKNNPMYVMNLPVRHDIQPENDIAIDRGNGYCEHMCTSRCGNDRECDCECVTYHIYHG